MSNSSKSTILSGACEWRNLNPDIWKQWESTALEEAAHERRFSMQYVVEQTRKHDHVNRIGEPVRVNNSHCPIWARMLATEHPEIRPYIELRQSEWDSDFPDVGRCANGK